MNRPDYSTFIKAKNLVGRGSGINPETLLEFKQVVEDVDPNPCIGCTWEHSEHEKILDHCHYHCHR